MKNEVVSGEEASLKAAALFYKLRMRKAICFAWKGQLSKSKEQFREILEDYSQDMGMDQAVVAQIQGCI